MAITIVSEPETHQPVYNYLNLKVQSDNTAQPLFKYIFDVYVNGTLVASIFQPPSPDAFGYLDVGRILENYLSDDGSTLLTSTASSVSCANTYVNDANISIGEQYSVAGVLTNFVDLDSTQSLFPFAGALKYYDRVNYVQTDYLVVTSGTTKKFLTNMPRTSQAYVVDGQHQWLSCLLGTTTVDRYRIDTFNSAGASISTATITFASSALTSGGRLKRIPVSDANVSILSGGSFSVGSNTILSDPDISYYDVYLIRHFGSPITDTQSSEKFRFYTKPSKCKYTPKEFYFKNRFGAFESFIFQLNSSESIDIDRRFYSKNNSFTQLNYAQTDRSSTALATRVKRKFSAVSDWITEDECRWLEDLLSSPTVWINDGDDNLVSINITNTSYDVLTKNNKKLFNITVEYELTVTEDRQRA